MTGLAAGTRYTALDWPPTVKAISAGTLGSISSTTYTNGSPEIGTTFVAPSSGRVRIITGLVGNGPTSQRLFLSPQVFLGTSASGTEVMSPSVDHAVGTITEQTASTSYERCTFLDGLTPGATYYARTMHRVTSGTGATASFRGIIIVPLP